MSRKLDASSFDSVNGKLLAGNWQRIVDAAENWYGDGKKNYNNDEPTQIRGFATCPTVSLAHSRNKNKL